MELTARLTADFIVVVHFAFVAFVLFGQILIVLGGILRWKWVRNMWFRGIHFASIAVVVLEAWWGVMCPLTTWEHELRLKAGQATYQGDFIAYWAHELLFYDFQPSTFTAIYTVFGTLVLGTLFLVPPRIRKAVPVERGSPAAEPAALSAAETSGVKS